METFKDVANTLRKAEEKRLAGEIQRTEGTWHDTSMSPLGVCGVGAIAYVQGMEVKKGWMDDDMREEWPVLAREAVHPEDGDTLDLLTILSDLHDGYGWTWPQLADWVESLEDRKEN